MSGGSSKSAGEIADLRKEVERLRRLNEALQESQPESTLIVNATTELFVQHSPDMRILWSNRAAGDSVGMQAEELTGRYCWEIWHQRNEPCVDCPVIKARETKQPEVGEIRSPDWRWYFIRAYPICDGKGDVTSLVEFALEITDRKKAEQSLRASEERHRLVVENTLVGVSICEGPRILFANRALLDMLGHQSLDEFAAVSFLDYLTPESRTRVRDRFERIERGEEMPRHFSVDAVRKDGEVRTFELTVSWTESAGSKYQHAIFIDVTERVRAEKLLRESEARYRALVETSRVGVAIVRGSQVVFGNRAILDMLGYQGLEEFTAVPTVEHVAAHARPEIVERLQKVGRLEDVPSLLVMDFVRKDGENRTLEVSIARIETGGEPLELVTAIDVTERARAEKALEESERRYRRITQHLTDYIYIVQVVNGQPSRTVHGPGCAAVTGYDSEEFAADPYLWLRMVHSEDRERVVAQARDVLSSREVPPLEHRIVRKDGQVRWVSNTPVFHFDAEGKLVSYDGLIQDITERKLAEEALRQSEEKLRNIIDHSTNLFYSHGLDHVLNYLSPRVETMLGYEPDEARMRWTDLLSDDPVNQKGIQLTEEAIRTGRPQRPYELEMLTRDGRRVWLEVHEAPVVVDGTTVAIVGAASDVTERHRSEKALRESEDRYRQLFEMESDAIILVEDSTGHILEVNPAASALYGYSRDEFLRQNIADLLAEPEGVRMLGDSACSVRPVLRHSKKDGTAFPVEISGRHFRWQERLVHIATVRDITERRRVEDERLEMERRLLHAQKLESLGVLAGGIAHDFNNLLMAILGNLDLALLDVSSLSPARFSIEQAKQAARRAADLTRQMLAYSGKGRFVTKPINLSELVQENAHLLKAAISKTVTLSLSLDRSLPPIMADPGQMQQVIMNLITNASEAIETAAGVVSLATGIEDCDSAYLSGSSLEEKPPAGRYVYVEVADTGCGMSEDTKQRLFDPFFSTKFTGRGLGMSAVSGIVHGHQGAIIVTSHVDKGSTVRVLFPAFTPKVAVVAPPERRQASRKDTEPAPSLTGLILLVDDEEIVLSLCRNILDRLGFRVLVAANGDEAVSIYREHAGEIDCVLLDLTMPQLDGVAAFGELQRVRPDVKVILSSGYSQEEATKRFQGRGLAGFIQKPYEVQSLREVLEHVLSAPAKPKRERRPKRAAGKD